MNAFVPYSSLTSSNVVVEDECTEQGKVSPVSKAGCAAAIVLYLCVGNLWSLHDQGQIFCRSIYKRTSS
ncbi:hypothetical protein TorRG33x02_313730 [Trema orientale]|uniref:Uncharacterized protein n=1 Tax=Trema orientale TaxID=63057 RepID=A0A2P5BP90_TREOI|nr:hypothetical protein TorRG33x02_313730 [Trema orientale]